MIARNILGALAATTAALLLCAATPAHVKAPTAASAGALSAELSASVRQAITATGLKKADIAVSIRDTHTGEVLVDVSGQKPLLPASNMKVITTGAALHALGPDFMFRTRLLRDGDRLTVVGDGDPSFGDPALLAQMVFKDSQGNVQAGLTVDGLLDRWIDAVRSAGVTRVRELVVDDRVFDRQFVHPAWPENQLGNSYCAQVSGLNFHANLLQAFLKEDKGQGLVERWSPSAPWIRVTNRSTASNGKKAEQTVWVGRTEDPTVYTLNGNMKARPADPIAVCVDNMPSFFARLLAERLRAAGVVVEQARTAQPTEAAPTGQTMGPVIQTPLKSVLVRCNTDSQNMYAESLLKRVGYARASGAPGSWTNGGNAIAQAVDERLGAGTAARGLTVSDGSGLSRQNRVAASLITAWMQSVAADPKLRDAFIESLAVAGETGTVAKRFKGLDTTKVFAPCKTGYINGVSCLSGYVGAVGHTPRFTFSVMCNELTEANAVSKAKDLQEKVVQLLAQSM
jgi:D-alanyl-D-alanine carboxypeptidase/D-alanyl-D-alanine-endopeptidase (penicillin-binding protein 4)